MKWKMGDTAMIFPPYVGGIGGGPVILLRSYAKMFTGGTTWECMDPNTAEHEYIFEERLVACEELPTAPRILLPTLSERQAALSEKAKRLRAARDLEPESIERDAGVAIEEAIKSGKIGREEAEAWLMLLTGKYSATPKPKIPEKLAKVIPRKRFVEAYPIGTKVLVGDGSLLSGEWEVVTEPTVKIQRKNPEGFTSVYEWPTKDLKTAPEKP